MLRCGPSLRTFEDRAAFRRPDRRSADEAAVLVYILNALLRIADDTSLHVLDMFVGCRNIHVALITALCLLNLGAFHLKR
jgi:hypothetical protein